MMKRTFLGVLCAMHGLPAFAGSTLQHDPFARPSLAISPAAPSGPNPASGKTGVAVEDATPWNPQLIAVMVAGKSSVVNIEGVMVRIGEEINGHRLAQVNDGEALFIKGRKRVVLRMDDGALRANRDQGKP
jgi:hypothetical protein